MESIKEYKAEYLFFMMVINQAITVFIPNIVSSDISNLILLILLIGFILCKIERIDDTIKQKFN